MLDCGDLPVFAAFSHLSLTHTQVHTHTGTHRHKRTQANTHTHISAQTNTLTHRHRDTETRTCKHWQIYPNLFWALQVHSSPSFLILEIKFWSKYLNNAMKLNLIKLKTTLWETQSIDIIFLNVGQPQPPFGLLLQSFFTNSITTDVLPINWAYLHLIAEACIHVRD